MFLKYFSCVIGLDLFDVSFKGVTNAQQMEKLLKINVYSRINICNYH